MSKFEQHISITSNDAILMDELTTACSEHKLSINQIKVAIQKGALWLTRGKQTQRIRKIKKTLKVNDTLHFYFDQKVLSQSPTPAQLISDQGDYSLWYKPYGMLSQGSKWSDHCTIARWAETHLSPQRPAFIVHRLDRAATGLILVAHSKRSARAFSQLFEHHQLDKRYHILVHGKLPAEYSSEQGCEVTLPIDDKKAKSTFYPLAVDHKTNISLLEVKIDTGRKHQIRKHAASLGLPVVGDRLHGDSEQPLSQQLDLQLCAAKLSFTCPFSQQAMEFVLPNELLPTLATASDN